MRKQRPLPPINMTPMIDIVFQMIIFFIFTIQLDKDVIDKNVKLEWARDARAVEDVAPGTVSVNIRDDGTISIAGNYMNLPTFKAIMQTTANRMGGSFPVVIRGDKGTPHAHVRQVMDVCKGVGIWQVSIAALKAKG